MPLLSSPIPFPRQSGVLVESAGILTATTALTSVTCGNATWGAWTQLLASTAKKAFMVIMVGQYENATVLCRMQLGVGANPNETPIADALMRFNSATAQLEYIGTYLARIPAGSRITARGRTASGAGYKNTIGAYLMEVN